MTIHQIWEEYRQEQPDGYSYSQFCYHFQVWRDGDEVTMHIEHKVGDKLFVDFAGKKLTVSEPHRAVRREVESFVAVLGASQLGYLEAVETQQKADLIAASAGADAHNATRFQRLPYSRRDLFDRIERAALQPLPAERFELMQTLDLKVQFNYHIELREDRHYYSVPWRLKGTRVQVLYNDKIASAGGSSPARGPLAATPPSDHMPPLHRYYADWSPERILRWAGDRIERAALQPLPAERFELMQTLDLKVQFNYHIELREDRHYYSVPWRLKGTRVQVLYNDRMVEIYHDHLRVAAHQCARTAGGYTTVADHMPPQHRFYADWSPERILRWAGEIGPEVAALVGKVLQEREHPEQGFKVALGIINLYRKYGEERLEQACGRALTGCRMLGALRSHGCGDARRHVPVLPPVGGNAAGASYYLFTENPRISDSR